MSELAQAFNLLNADYPTCVQRVNYPMHKGATNPRHGKFFFVGKVPAACVQEGKSMFYDSEEQAIEAARKAGATRIQRTDCSFALGE